MYAELQCKTNFSFLRGASDAAEYVRRAVELGLPALAITDVNGVYALPRAFEALREYPQTRLISGCELRIRDHCPISFLVRDRAAYGLLCRMITAAHAGKEKGTGELTLPELVAFLEMPGSRGLVALVTAGRDANLPLLRELLGDRLHLRLSLYLDGMDEERVTGALEASRHHGVRVVATNDVHYHFPERSRLQDAMTCVREGVTLQTAGFKLFANEERYLKSPVQMRSLFRELPDAIRATLDIAESCTFSLSELSYQYPSEWIPPGQTAQGYLESLVWQGAHDRYRGAIPIEVEKQVLHELSLTRRMQYADYFLTVYSICAFARSRNIYCQGRGSAANSILCYCLGITVIDPVKMNLLFERFLSEDRGEPPDIDVDFEHERREEVIQWIYEQFGRHRAAMISAVRTYRRRSAFLEMSKAVGVPVGTLSSEELERDFDRHAGTLAQKRDKIDSLVEELKGFPRHLSIHSCGFTLSAHPIIETVPVEPARMEARTIVQWDKHDLDTLGLIKIDVLSLGFLTALHKACDLIGIDMNDIPKEDDPRVYDMICRGDTIGTFQIESRAQIATLGITQPRCFHDLIVQVAIVRPGPTTGTKAPYILRREAAKNGKPYQLNDPVLEKILGRTYGVPIFQEQVMKLAIEKAGFTPGEADRLRRSISAWRSSEAVSEHSDRLHAGLLRGGMSEEGALEMVSYLKTFASYGFPFSHAASFAVIAYMSAWLRHYHHAELLVGLLNSQPMGFYPVHVLVNDALRHGVRVLPVDPNVSVWDATLEAKKTVRMGFRNVQGIRQADVERMIAERARAPFRGLQDFLARTFFSREVIETMAMADVFLCFGRDQRHSFWKSLELRALFERKTSAQLSLFEQQPGRDSDAEEAPPVFQPMTLYEGIIEDYRGLSYSLRGGAMAGIRSENSSLPRTNSVGVKNLPSGSLATYAGIVIVLQRPPTANGVAFMTLEDEVGSVDVVFFKNVYEKFLQVIRGSRFLVVKGKVERRGLGVSFLAEFVTTFDSGAAHRNRNQQVVSAGEHPRNLGGFIK